MDYLQECKREYKINSKIHKANLFYLYCQIIQMLLTWKNILFNKNHQIIIKNPSVNAILVLITTIMHFKHRFYSHYIEKKIKNNKL